MIEEHDDDLSQLESCISPVEISMQPDGCLFFESLPRIPPYSLLRH
jgi:hypothetical protein